MRLEATASLAALRQRAALLARVRSFFAARGVLEVETPALSAAGLSDLALESITAGARCFGSRPCYLQTSPEYAMKRLLAAGSGDIFQIARVFRDDELGRWHQPEFTLLEWYRVGYDDDALMGEVADLIGAVLDTPRPVVRMTYAQAFRRHLGASPNDDAGTLARRIAAAGIDVPANVDASSLIDLAFSMIVAQRLDPAALTFIHDFPANQAALARLKAGTPPVAARFEAFAGGLELANGFAELTDPEEQRRRFEADLDGRRRTNRHVPPLDEAFLAALASLPACAGVAIGVDRLIALALNAPDLATVLAFTHEP